MNINRPLMPGFLKSTEQKLLLNKPLIWSTRVHLVLYYGILFNLLLAGLCFVAPMDIKGASSIGYWIGFVIIIAIIALTVWLIYLLRFNVFKKYGNIKPLHALVTFLLYFVSTGIIVLSVFVYPAVECVRANMAFGDEELVHDINTMNVRLCQMEHRLLNIAWVYDTVALVQDDKPVDKKITYDEDEVAPDTVAIPSNGRYFLKLDSTDFYDKLAQTDSVVKLNDSLYLMYKTPELQFMSCDLLEDAHTREKILPSFEIYNRSLRNPPVTIEGTAIAKEFYEVQKKYLSIPKSNYTDYEEVIQPGEGPMEIVRKKYHLSKINNSLYKIVYKKNLFTGSNLNLILRLFYYFTLGISLLIFIFRNTTVRTFFLSLLSGVLLSIFTALILSIARGSDKAFIGSMIGYTLLFFVGSIFTFSLTKRSVVIGIMTNLFVFIVPVLPLLMVDFIFRLKSEQYYREYGTYYAPFVDQYYLYAEIGGAVLLLVLLAIYINKVYRRWYSLPQN
jgi:hypothetical protein